MATTEATLRRGLQRRGRNFVLTLDPAFQGLPDTAHGGSILAAFAAAAALPGPVTIRGLYRRRVPLATPLELRVGFAEGSVACQLRDARADILVDGGVTPAAPAGPVLSTRPADGETLPISRTCFVCGVDNALGLRAQLCLDESTVGGRWQPRELLRDADGSLAPVALTALLDETAFWTGALASGESGMTTDLAVTLHGPMRFGEAVTVAGARRSARQRADDPRYWETAVGAFDDAGHLVASARITFVAVRGAARRLIGGMLAMNPPAVIRRVFPAYVV